MRKPRVIKKCVAHRYAGPHERIVEFSDDCGNGGLISLVQHEDGRMTVDVYRYGPRVEVRIGQPDPFVRSNLNV
jgi:hypothetical protein